MKERPVIFNGEMVRAILDGRKTQTRRLVPEWQRPKHYPENDDDPHYNWMAVAQSDRRWGYGVFGETEEARAKELSTMAPCPFGNAGDRLWVRETFGDCGNRLVYRADTEDGASSQVKRWVPSIHMPRDACRILLEITAVRVERLNDISEEDAKAEGVKPAGDMLPDYPDTFLTPKGDFATAKVAFQRLWQSIYGEESWGDNPWVWVIEFKQVSEESQHG
ncbi:hypothetical protein BSF37_03180 [Serratia marcescens]|uniref:hypothetical protein n=1 Tax=Serratia marcescens TaxID=615 RepID=UPI00147EC656|nr:hypothetical protein [Serratia marcescens]NMM70789.1 hypothetical protein [Serratia marcescens]